MPEAGDVQTFAGDWNTATYLVSVACRLRDRSVSVVSIGTPLPAVFLLNRGRQNRRLYVRQQKTIYKVDRNPFSLRDTVADRQLGTNDVSAIRCIRLSLLYFALLLLQLCSALPRATCVSNLDADG